MEPQDKFLSEDKVDLLMKLNPECLTLIFSEAEKTYDYVENADVVLSTKASNVITLFSAIIISLTAYVCQSDKMGLLIVLSILIIAVSFTSMYYMYRVIKPSEFSTKGVSPNTIINTNNTPIDVNVTDEDKIKRVLRSRIYNIQKSISFNQDLNTYKSKNYNKAMFILMVGFTSVIVAGIVIKLIYLTICQSLQY